MNSNDERHYTEEIEETTEETIENLCEELDRVIETASEPTDEAEVDLFALTDKADEPIVQAKSAHKSAGSRAVFGAKCVGALLATLVLLSGLYLNGLLNLIDYKAAGDFEQYDSLSDTDYRVEEEETFTQPVSYNPGTTLDGFDESMIDVAKEDVFNVLLIGTDVRGGTYDDRGNTDSMILMSINTRDRNVKLTSFMRDMYVEIPDHGKNRLNAAYAYGGPQLLFDTLKLNFDVDVDHYIRVNFANFRKIIDNVGGVEIELTEAEAKYMNKYAYKYHTEPVEAGLQTLDGSQALSYARCRKIDSDFNRTQRQRKVILAFVDEIKRSNIPELNRLLNTMLPMIQTNVSKARILSLMVDSPNYLNNSIETLNVPIKNSWQSVTINKMAVLTPNFKLNKTAITAHIYSTWRLDVEGTSVKQQDVVEAASVTSKQTGATTQNGEMLINRVTAVGRTAASSATTKSTATTTKRSSAKRSTTTPSASTQKSATTTTSHSTAQIGQTTTAEPSGTTKPTTVAQPSEITQQTTAAQPSDTTRQTEAVEQTATVAHTASSQQSATITVPAADNTAATGSTTAA